MSVIFPVSVGLYFISFYLLASLVVRGLNRRRLARIQEAARRLPDQLNNLGEKLNSPASSQYYRQKLLEAGRPRDLDVDGLMSLKVLGCLAGIGISLLIGLIAGLQVTRIFILILILAPVGFFALDAWLARLIERRKKAVSLALPDILDMLTISVEAGLGFDAAISKVVKNFRGALAEELFRFLQEIQLGRSRQEAWRDFSNRINVPEVNSFVLAILQADVFGVSIGKVLRVQADDMRVKRRQRAEEIAMKAPVKVVFPLVLCIFPALMIVILGPAGIKIVEALTF